MEVFHHETALETLRMPRLGDRLRPSPIACDVARRDITGDALLTQRAVATYVIEQQAHYHFTVKSNQPTQESDVALLYDKRGASDFVEVTPPNHGRIETRSIWCTTAQHLP